MMVDNWRSREVSELRYVVRLDNQSEMVEEVSWWRDARR